MSGHRSGRRISDDEINELISKLQALLPELSLHGAAGRSSVSKLLHETCQYIRRLNREVDSLSNRLLELMETMDGDSPQADIIRSLLRSL